MPAYQNPPFNAAPVLLVSDKPQFLYGKYKDRVAPTQFQITSVAIASDVATITGYITSGEIPAVGSLISIRGTQTGSGEFNVSNVAITGVTIDAVSGQGTITFALTESNVSTTTDAGLAIVPQPIAYEALANGSSIAAATPNNDPNTDGARTFQAQAFFGSLPTACTVTLQGAPIDNDAAYQDLGPVATVVGGAVTLSQGQFTLTMTRFLRFNVSGVTGGSSPTIAAVVLF